MQHLQEASSGLRLTAHHFFFFFFFCTEKKRNFQHPLGGKEIKSSQYLSSTALYLSKIIFIETTPQGSLCLELNGVLYFSSHFTS